MSDTRNKAREEAISLVGVPLATGFIIQVQSAIEKRETTPEQMAVLLARAYQQGRQERDVAAELLPADNQQGLAPRTWVGPGI